MSEDSFIREVEEELRTERLQNFWDKYGNYLIAGAVAIVVATGGYRFYEYYSANQSAAAGDSFMEAVRLSDAGKQDEALAAFAKLEGEGGETYRVMALMRGAAELAAKGEKAEAIAKFDAVAADNSANENMRSISRIRAAMLLVDTGTVADVEQRVGELALPGAPYRSSAREALGLAHYQAGDLEKAFKQFEMISKDTDTPTALSQRTSIMLDLIASQGGPVLEK